MMEGYYLIRSDHLSSTKRGSVHYGRLIEFEVIIQVIPKEVVFMMEGYYLICSDHPSNTAVLPPNEIWGYRFLTGMICMIYKEIPKVVILV